MMLARLRLRVHLAGESLLPQVLFVLLQAAADDIDGLMSPYFCWEWEHGEYGEM